MGCRRKKTTNLLNVRMIPKTNRFCKSWKNLIEVTCKEKTRTTKTLKLRAVNKQFEQGRKDVTPKQRRMGDVKI